MKTKEELKREFLHEFINYVIGQKYKSEHQQATIVIFRDFLKSNKFIEDNFVSKEEIIEDLEEAHNLGYRGRDADDPDYPDPNGLEEVILEFKKLLKKYKLD